MSSQKERPGVEFLDACGMTFVPDLDMDQLCFAPGTKELENGEDGDANEITEPKPIGYRHTPSGLEDFRNDIRRGIEDEKARYALAMAQAEAEKKARKEKKKKNKPDKDGVTQEYLMEEGQVPVGYIKNDQKDRKADTATHLSDEVSTELEDSNVKAMVFMISGCEDSQTSADVSNVSSFSLPDPNGRAGGACTSALLKVLYGQSSNSSLTFVQVLKKMRTILKSGKYSQIPQLTSSRKMDVTQKFDLIPPACTGTKRAILIGINYVGQTGQLSGCHNDCLNMKDYVTKTYGIEEGNVVVLMDDGKHTEPTRANILAAYAEAVAISESGDALFCHYSGHGGRVRDDDWGEEEDGYDETLVPVDYASAGQIGDDDLYDNLVCAMPEGSTLVALMDCCHSGTVLDLPYKYRADGTGNGFGASANSQLLASGPRTRCLMCFIILVIIFFLALFMPLFYID